jgi:hypothetical protein
MKALSWNMRQRGGPRIDGTQTTIAAHNPGTLVLSEFDNNVAGANSGVTLRPGGTRKVIFSADL